jgi:transposase
MTPREAELTRQLEAALSALSGMEALRRENQLLRQKLDQITRRFFGVSSEQLPSNQLELVLALPEVEVEVRPGKIEPGPSLEKKTQRSVRKARVPEHLPVVEEVLEPEDVQAAPEQWRRIGEEVSEQLDYEPGRFFRRRLVRPRYVQRTEPDAAPVIAPLPERLLERSLPAPGLLAHILVSKYCDHLPLYRQERIYATRHGVELPRQTMARWVGLSADWLRPIYDMILTGVMAGGYVQVDETPVEYLDPGRGKTGQGYLWTCLRPGGDVVFRWETSRAAKCLDKLLPVDFSGVLQCDGYAAYGSFARRHPHPLTLAGCWAHVRRKFYEGRNESPLWAGWVLRQIQHLYRVEAVLRQNRAGPRLREALRSSESRMIVERLGRVLARMQPKTFPTSLLGEAIDFARGQWPRLLVFLTDGRVEIDNNQIENAIRPTALGKNYAEIRIMPSTAAGSALGPRCTRPQCPEMGVLQLSIIFVLRGTGSTGPSLGERFSESGEDRGLPRCVASFQDQPRRSRESFRGFHAPATGRSVRALLRTEGDAWPWYAERCAERFWFGTPTQPFSGRGAK